MARWARLLLIASMLGWTALTAFAGWHVLAGGAGDTPPTEAASVVFDVAAPGEGRSIYSLPRDEAEFAIAAAHAPADVAADAAGPQPEARSYAVPPFAGSAGIETLTWSAGRDGPGAFQPKQRPASKGIVVLDPGHGNGDPGATHYLSDGSGRWDITEADSNLRNAELIRDNLVAMGYDVYLTREDFGARPAGGLTRRAISLDLWWRSQFPGAVEADVFLAIHGNGAVVKSISGPETWYCGLHREGAANERLAQLVQQAMMEALHEYGYSPPDRGIKEDAGSHHGDFCQFVVTRESVVPAALLEFLFLSNDADAAVLVDDRSHVLMASHVAKAIDAFLSSR
jgi:N-acetylmuramoyl-L-alanine amidase